DAFLTEIAGLLRASRPAQYVVTDDGWRADRDVSVALGHWGWLDLRALIEEHGGPKVLLRLATRLRPTQRGVVLALALAAFAGPVTSAAVALRWPLLSIAGAVGVGVVVAHAIWQATKVVAVSRQAILRATAAAGMIPMEVRDSGKTRRLSP